MKRPFVEERELETKREKWHGEEIGRNVRREKAELGMAFSESSPVKMAKLYSGGFQGEDTRGRDIRVGQRELSFP